MIGLPHWAPHLEAMGRLEDQTSSSDVILLQDRGGWSLIKCQQSFQPCRRGAKSGARDRLISELKINVYVFTNLNPGGRD